MGIEFRVWRMAHAILPSIASRSSPAHYKFLCQNFWKEPATVPLRVALPEGRTLADPNSWGSSSTVKILLVKGRRGWNFDCIDFEHGERTETAGHWTESSRGSSLGHALLDLLRNETGSDRRPGSVLQHRTQE